MRGGRMGWANTKGMMQHYVDPGNGQLELFLKTTFKIVV